MTEVPEHIAPAGEAAILMDGVTVGVTVIVIALEVTVVGLAQAALEVISQVMMFPFAKLALV